MERLFDLDPVTKIRRNWYVDPADGSVVIDTQQDVTDIVESNLAARNQFDERAPWKGDMHRVASIPLNILMDLQKKGILNDEKAFKAWLNDPANLAFRTRLGRV